MNKREILYKGNSVITLEHKDEYAYPVVVKKAAKSLNFEKLITALENEFKNIQILKDIQGIRKCFELTTLENQPALILEYIDGETLQEHISRNSSDLHSKLKIALDLSRILAEMHQQNLIHLDLISEILIFG
jgi:tRNA A-37 threonylcarbamoyl transferase component Bud32